LIQRYATDITGTSRQVVSEHGFDGPEFNHIPKRALHCGFDCARFAGDPVLAKASICAEFGWPPEVRILLFAGRTDRGPDLGHPQNHKNSGFAVNLGIEACKRDSSLRMIMCGAPSVATPMLQSRINQGGCQGRIVMVGIRRNIETFMLGANLLLFPSRGEGLGMVAVEAQAAGLPVLASTSVPTECLVVDGMVRFLDVSSDLQPWIRAIQELLKIEKSDREACNAKVAASAFSIINSAATLEYLYGLRAGNPNVPRN
jgi:glycosyltransferase involved in cell wall biosynthesis